MKFLHTSDWYLGTTLYGRQRYGEFEAFLEWLDETIVKEDIEVLLIAGNIFDTSTPDDKAQQLYYEFLCKVANSCCDHVVIIGGNRDSSSLLNAPKALLKALHVHIVTAVCEDPYDEVIVLGQQPEAIVCAVPYLGYKETCEHESSETFDKNAGVIAGLHEHYAAVCDIAEQKRFSFLNQSIPVIGMGHLFIAGSEMMHETNAGDIFPSSLDYVALGHLYAPQKLAGTDHIRYSGSPIPMEFSEAEQQKTVCVIEFDPGNKMPDIKEIEVPCFQTLVRIAGDRDMIVSRIEELSDSNTWLEIEYTGVSAIKRLREDLDELIDGTSLQILSLNNKSIVQSHIQLQNAFESQLVDQVGRGAFE